MAKPRSAKKFRKIPAGSTTVNSRAYGRHERAARGSKSKAELNDAMKAHSRRMIGSNIPAKLIYDALQPYRENFKGGLIWQRLVKHFAQQAKDQKEYSVQGINYWDLNQTYPTSRVLSPFVQIITNPSSSILNITVGYTFSDRFLERKKDISAFRITIILLFADFVNNEIITIPVVLPDKSLEDQAPYSFIVQAPEGAGSWLACFKAEPCIKGALIVNKSNTDKAMCLMEGGTW